jgi:uncharacterized protein (TIGR03437 family)
LVSPAAQTITFQAIGQHRASDASFALQATASSGLPVTFTVVSGPATISGGTLAIAGVGSIMVQADQAGSGNYTPAAPVRQTFTVILAQPVIGSILNAASYASGVLAPNSYMAAFGISFEAPTTSGDPGPVTVAISDAQGHEGTAQPFYTGFGQIDFLVPPGLAPGSASVTLINAAGPSAPFLVAIGRTSPGLFTADASGRGAPAGQILILAADGTRSTLPAAQCLTAPLSCSTVAITFAQGSQVYLVLYGTGIRDGSKFSVMIGNTPAPVIYAGPQGDFPGLDQVNVSLPPTLAGSGEVDLALTVDGTAANTLRVRFQ